MIRCLNIDWLELFCYEDVRQTPCDSIYFERMGWSVRVREYGTRVYAQMFTLLDKQGYPFLEIRRKPLSDKMKDGGLFDEKACHIRVSNYYCYRPDVIAIVREFLNRYNYILVRIFRIDICNDFVTFDRGDDPAKFIQRYIDGRYSKVNQTNISAHGVDRWDGRTWQTISWGKPKSMISTKIYCKTIEMEQVKDKPYIRQAWWESGLIDNPITMQKRQADGTMIKPLVWRVEFSIKSSAKKWYLIERSDTRKQKVLPMPHTLDIYDTKEKLEVVFASLQRHYFHFKIYEEGKRKDRCKDKVLFDFSHHDFHYKVDRLASHEPANSKTQRLINQLMALEEKTIERDALKAIHATIEYLKNTQAKEFIGNEMTYEDVIALKLLIQERMAGDKSITLQDIRERIKRATEGSESGIF